MSPLRLRDLTVIVPTRNEEANILKFLDSVPSSVHLIVVDSSDDRTHRLVADHRPWRTQVIRADVNIPQARQIGADEAETPWLLYTDADVVFPPSYFARLTALEVSRTLAGIVGTKSTIDGYDGYHRWFTRGQAAVHKLGIPAATGSNMLVRRSALIDVGGFDPRLSVNEDTEVMFRIAKAGYAVNFEPDLVVESTDHRRLERGVIYKVAHGAVRNSALWLGVFGEQVRANDWGYWKRKTQRTAKAYR